MTGELFAVLKYDSILGLDDFRGRRRARRREVPRGTAAPRARPAPPPGRCCTGFSEPARWRLPGRSFDPGSVADYLSGLLIGSEIGAGVEWARHCGVAADRATLIGASALCTRYAVALAEAGVAVEAGPATAAARGLWAIATEAGLVR